MFKKLMFFICLGLISMGVNNYAFGVEEIVEDMESDVELADRVSSEALLNYDTNGSLFEKITVLEQEKVVAQLEKERAQLDLDLERLNAERIKLQIELDTLSGRAEQQQQELEAAKAQLEIQTEKLKRQMNAVDEEPAPVAKAQEKKEEQATVEEVSTGQNRRIAVGKELDGYIVKSISLNEGIVFEKNGETESLNIGK